MNKENIRKMFAETLTEEEKRLMTIASVICMEGLEIAALCNLHKPDDPHVLCDMISSLDRRNWLFLDHNRIYCDTEVSCAILDKRTLRVNYLMCLLSNLDGYLSIEPLDDYVSRQQYFVAARLLLGHIMEKWDYVIGKDDPFVKLFMKSVLHFASNVELSFPNNKRRPVTRLEERIDYKLLSFCMRITGDISFYRPLGTLYANIFRYDEAIAFFNAAELSSTNDNELLISRSKMNNDLGLTAMAFHYAYDAYLNNMQENSTDKNIRVCLYLSLLCGFCGIRGSCIRWFREGKRLIKKRDIPEIHPLRIMFFEIESLLAIDNPSTANEYLEKAELMCLKLYSNYSPELSTISTIRYLIYMHAGLSRKSIEAYRDYVNYNHFNYGYSAADISALYSAIIESSHERGCFCTADIYEALMQPLHTNDATFAPGVRFYKAISETSTCLTRRDYDKCATHLEKARQIFIGEISPDKALVDALSPVFEGEMVPDCVIGKEYARCISLLGFEIDLGRGKYHDARKHILNEINNEANLKDRLLLSVNLGRITILKGNIEKGIKEWKELISRADASCRFEVSMAITEWAIAYELYYYAVDFFEEAMQAEYMLYATTKDIAVALRNYADVLETCGMQDKSDELWQQAVRLMKAANDLDGLALVYSYWGATKQDHQAEILIAKAIKYWKQEPGVFDETLSYMYWLYSLNLGMQGKTEEAKAAASKAVSLYPSTFPENWAEAIEPYM